MLLFYISLFPFYFMNDKDLIAEGGWFADNVDDLFTHYQLEKHGKSEIKNQPIYFHCNKLIALIYRKI